MSDIVERLKKMADAHPDGKNPGATYWPEHPAVVCTEAAALITSLEADNARLRAEAEWRFMADAPTDGTVIEATKWWPANQSKTGIGRWTACELFAFDTDEKSEPCFQSIPRGTRILNHAWNNGMHEYDYWRWRLPTLPTPISEKG